MDFPPLDDTRWDRLLGAVIGQRPTVGDPDAPLASPFPATSEATTNGTAETEPDSREDTDQTIDLDSYA